MGTVRKIKYGNKATAITTVLHNLCEEVIDLSQRLDESTLDASAQLVAQHQQGIAERLKVRAELIYKLSLLLK